MSDATELARRLYVARHEAALAKQLHRLKVDEVGTCDGLDHECGPCYHDDRLKGKVAEWCEVCQAKEPLYRDWRRKSRQAAALLCEILRLGKRMEEIRHE